MSLDLIEIALEQFTDWEKFEKLASEVMRDEGYPDIRPLGGFHDGGQDALVERFFASEGKRMRVAFQFTLRTDVAAKVRETIKRLDDRGTIFHKLVIVTRAKISSETQEAIRKQAKRDNQVDLEIYDRKTLVNRLADASTGMFQRYFSDIRHQVNTLLQPQPRLLQAQEEREKEFLKVCYAFTFAPDAQLTRKSLLDETVLAVLGISGAAPMRAEQLIPVAREAFSCEVLREPAQVAGSLERLTKKGLVDNHGGAFSTSLSGRTRVEAARISLEATEKSVVSDIVTDVCAGTVEPIYDNVRAQLELNARELLVEYFRMNGLELAYSFLSKQKPFLVYSQGTPRLFDIASRRIPPHLGSLLAIAVGKALCTPSSEQAHYFATCSRAYIAFQLMNLDPSLREFQQTRFLTKVFVLDTDFVLNAIIQDLPLSATYRNLVRLIVTMGARVVVPNEVLEEVTRHLVIAPRTYDYFGAGLAAMSEELCTVRIWNALVAGFWYRSRVQGWTTRADFMRYRENYFDAENPMGFAADVVRESLPSVEMGKIASILQVSISESEVDAAQSVLMDIAAGTLKGKDRTEEQNRELASQDAQLMLSVSKYNLSPGESTNAILENKAYILTSSGRYLRAAEKLEVDPRLATRPHILVALLDMIEPSSLDDRQFVSLFENPLLQQSVEACWVDIKVLLDAGLELREKSITRLRYDVEKRLHTQISSLRQADAVVGDEDEAEPHVGDKEHIALLDEAERLGYQPTRLLAKLREEGKVKETEIARLAAENEELREAVMRFGKKKARWLRRLERLKGRQ